MNTAAEPAARSFVGKCRACKRAVQVSAVAVESRAAVRTDMGRVITPKRVNWEIAGGAFAGQRSGLAGAWNGKWQMAVACPGCARIPARGTPARRE
jgi:hypothetical protein